MGITYQDAVREFGWLVDRIARRKARRGLELEDLRQEGYVGLMRAVRTWREGGATFKSWASLQIATQIRDSIGRAQVPEFVPWDDDCGTTQAPQETALRARELFATLSASERAIVAGLGQGETLKEIAAAQHMSFATTQRTSAAVRQYLAARAA